jgi:hypothetical protein
MYGTIIDNAMYQIPHSLIQGKKKDSPIVLSADIEESLNHLLEQ